MVRKGISNNSGVVNRVLGVGFDAIAEYDALGALVGSAGQLSSDYAWARIAALALSGHGQEAAEHALAIELGDLFVAALGVEGGGVLLAVAERVVVGTAADDLARRLDQAIANVVDEKWVPLLLGAGAVTLAGILYLLSHGRSS